MTPWRITQNAIYICYGIFLATVVHGCAATIPAGDDQNVTPDEMALIVDSYWGSFRYSKAGIWGVDGTDLNFKERVTVPPGKHSISIYCARGYFLGSQLNARFLHQDFTAKSGHKYRVMCSAKDSRYYSWIVDLTDDQIVAGEEP